MVSRDGEKMEACLKKISYKELKEQSEINHNDKYCMISNYLTSQVKDTLLANPNLNDDAQTALNLIVCDGVVAGRNMLMPTKVQANKRIIIAQTGGSFEISEQMRGKGLGTMAFQDSIFNSEYDMYIGQLYSTTAIAIVKKLGLIVFETPSFYKLCKSRSYFEAKGKSGLVLRVGSCIADAVLKVSDLWYAICLMLLKSRYIVKKERIIPEWVNDITLGSSFDYFEVHDRNWLQWCLDYKFTSDSKDQQCYYSIYDKRNNPKGFFMTKERFEKKSGKYTNITRGTVVEWGSYDEKEIDEADINVLAIKSFGRRVDSITTILSDTSLTKKIKSLGFVRHGEYQMTIKPGKQNTNEISNQNKWRIRYGGCNTIVI